MRCSGCGKSVPFGGHVCPYCNRDKSSDQTGTVATGAGLVLGGFIGNLIGDFGGMLIGGFVLGLLAAFVSMSGKNHTAKKPPRVRVDDLPAVKPQAVPIERVATLADTPEARLRRLDELLSKGLLSADEHQEQRVAIISML